MWRKRLHPFLLLLYPGAGPAPLPTHTLTHTLLGKVHGAWHLGSDVKDMLWGEWSWSPGGFRGMQDCMHHLPRKVGAPQRLNMKCDTMVGTIPLWWGLFTFSWILGLHRG